MPRVLLDVSAGVVAFGTGIQRVVRDMAQTWPSDEVGLVVWDEGLNAFRPPSKVELSRLGVDVLQTSSIDVEDSLSSREKSWFLVPDFVHQFSRREGIKALVETRDLNLCYFVHDCVPVTMPETTIQDMTPAFSEYVGDLSRANLVFTNSASTAEELTSTWRVAEPSKKRFPPVIAVGLPNELIRFPARPHDQKKGELRVLWVGSSEPRKNLGSALFVCERLWSQGLVFKLVLVGSRSWSDDDEQNYLNALMQRGRDIERHVEATDEALIGFYRKCDVLIFPSLHEGFGLPINEALGFGLPVITSRFGSMGQLAGAGGCIAIDPNDDQALEVALKSLLTDFSLRKKLTEQALTTQQSTGYDFVARLREGLQLTF